MSVLWHWVGERLPTVFDSTVTTATVEHLGLCFASSCPGMENDPEHPALICTLPLGHEGMHHQEGVRCSWMEGK